jgi:DNA-binding MarR family transcriptional regulator
MTSRLDRLERAGLITRTPSRTDRRAVLVRLTRRGERIAERALHAVIAADEVFLEPLSKRQRDSIAASLKKLLLPFDVG